MEAAWIAVTLISLAVASVMSATTWRLRREERRRSAARVAALAAEIQTMEAGNATPMNRPPVEMHDALHVHSAAEPHPKTSGSPALAAGLRPTDLVEQTRRRILPEKQDLTRLFYTEHGLVWPPATEPAGTLWLDTQAAHGAAPGRDRDVGPGAAGDARDRLADPVRRSQRLAPLGADSGIEGAEPAIGSPDLFRIAQQGRPGRRRFLSVAAIGVIVVGAIGGAALLIGRGATASAPTTGAPGVSQSTAPLELMSLRHQREGDVVSIAGLVRNPARGATVKGVSAVALLFDRRGTFVTSGRARLDFPMLAPGDDSPFTIAVPRAANVGRYRVSFRTEEGVVPHVDRRGEEASGGGTAARLIRGGEQ